MAAEQLNINTRVKVRGQAIYGIVVNPLPNSDGKILFLDEETGMPSIMHGQTGVSGTGRTAAGLSMLMGGRYAEQQYKEMFGERGLKGYMEDRYGD